jgi:hypothetical protein
LGRSCATDMLCLAQRNTRKVKIYNFLFMKVNRFNILYPVFLDADNELVITFCNVSRARVTYLAAGSELLIAEF